jgi:hypothetical protein
MGGERPASISARRSRLSFAKTRSSLVSTTWEMRCNAVEPGYMRPRRAALYPLDMDIELPEKFRTTLGCRHSGFSRCGVFWVEMFGVKSLETPGSIPAVLSAYPITLHSIDQS